MELFREIVEHGYDSSRTLLSEAARPWRTRRGLVPRRVRRLLPRPPERLDDDGRAAVQRLLEADGTVDAAHALVQRFHAPLRDKDAAGLETWLAEARASGIAGRAGVANGTRADHAAVAAADREAWSNGRVEG